VTAKDLGTGKEQKITITASSGLNEQEIEKMVNEAKTHAGEDKAIKEKIEIKNRADSMVYQTEKQIKEYGDKLTPEIKQPVIDGIEKLKKQIEADDTEGMKTTMTDIEQHLIKFGQEIYSHTQQNQQQGQQDGGQQQAGGQQQQSSSKPGDDNIVDAEVVDDGK